MKELLYKIKWRGRHASAFAAWERILANEHRSLDELMAEQELARQKVVRHALAHSRFYAAFYGDAGLESGDVGRDGWFGRLPILTKKHLRDHFDDILDGEQRAHLGCMTTGGSTGTPTKAGYDRRIPEEVYYWRMQNWFGVRPWDDHAYIWREPRKGALARFANALAWWPTLHLKLDASVMTCDDIVRFIRKFNEVKPSLVYGYVGAVARVAQFILDEGIAVSAPKCVCTTSAPLAESQREMIGKAFGAPVVDQYGSCEIRWIAQQCPECKGLHVNVEHVYVEFVDGDGVPVRKGEYGRTLLTNLEDMVFPLIRYENGDRGRWLEGECACGRSLPVIDSVKGRESESFTLPSGKIVNGEFLTTIFDDEPGLVTGFRLVQHRDLNVTIEYVPAVDDERVVRYLEKATGMFNGEVAVDFRRVGEIAHDRGKARFVVRER